MTHESSMEGTSLNHVTCGSSDSTIVINIKTLDSQLYSFSVKKNLPVPALKKEIVTKIGVPLDQQRLIYRGKVLKDDQLLSDHSVEDGDTLHLVVRPEVQSQPTSSTVVTDTSRASSQANDSGSGLQHPRVGQVAHSVFLGTVNIGDRPGEGMPIDLSQIVPAVLNLLGAQNLGATGGPSLAPIVSASNQANSGTGAQSSLNSSRTQAGNSASGGFVFPTQSVPLSAQFTPMPSTGSVNQPLVIADALTTLSEFIERMQGVLQSNNNSVNNEQYQPRSATSFFDSRGLPTSEFLCSVLDRTHLLLRDNAVTALSHVSTRLQRDGNSSDPLLRTQIQTEVMQLGLAMQHLGAMLLELGRVTMTLRMGQSPADSSVYAGPAVYISPAGPNPIMVQPFPFQASSLFGISASPFVPDFLGRGPTGDPSGNINIHVQTGSSAPVGATTNGRVASSSETIHVHPSAEHATTDRNCSSDASSTRGIPSRTVAAALQARAVPEASGQVLNVVYPLHVRTQQSVPIRSAAQLFSTTASRGGQPHEQNLVTLPPLRSESFPVLVAEVTARIPMVPSRSAPIQGPTVQSSAIDGSDGAVNSDIQSDMSNSTFRPPEVHDGIMHMTQLNVERNGAPCSDSQPQNVSSRLESSDESSSREYNGVSSPEDLLKANNVYVDSEKEVGTEISKRSSFVENFASAFSVSRNVEQQIHLKDDWSSSMNSGRSSEELLATNSTGTPANVQSGSMPSCSSDVNSLNREQDSFEAGQSHPSNRTIEGHIRAPLGLGVGGLQSKKRNKSVKSKGKDDGQVKASSSDQHSFVRGNEVFNSLASQTSHLDRDNTSKPSTQFPSISQLVNSTPLGEPVSSEQRDFAGMMANAMQSSGFGSLLSGLAAHSRVPTGDLRTMLEHCVQNPAVQNTFSQLVQQVGQSGEQPSNMGTVQSRFDFKGMIQQLLPAVSQALGSSSISSAAVTEHQPEPKDVQTSSVESLSDSDYQVDLGQVLEKIEQNDDPRNIFRALLRISGRLYGEQTIYQDIVELGNDEELTKEFMEVLKRDIRRRLSEESTSGDES